MTVITSGVSLLADFGPRGWGSNPLIPSREGGLGQVEGRSGQAEQAGRLGLGDTVLTRMTKHLVLDLHEVGGVEEAGAVEPRRAHSLRLGVQRAELAQSIGLGRVLGHSSTCSLYVNHNTPQ
ncbi:hypothetical protein LP417_13880 [Polaromonas sp. P1-6]|nr:hypothetical protein LP417_13880 [Polaromonas sp. P1-6]